MTRTVHALLLVLRDLPQPRVLRILGQSVALTLLIFSAIGAAIFFGARGAIDQADWLAGPGRGIAEIAVILALIAASWLLFRAVAMIVIGFFADAIIADVEARHYPEAARRAVDPGWRQELGLAFASLARLIGGNLLALPVYILLLVTGIGTPIFAFIVNALLLGRDLEAMILARHPALPRLGRGARWSLGALSAAAFLVPVANLLAPLIGAAMAVHMIHLRAPRSAKEAS